VQWTGLFVCYGDMVLRIRMEDIAPGRDYRAAYVALSARRGRGTLHDHDFHEVMWVLGGSGTHELAGRALPLTVGDLVLVRPADGHRIEAAGQKRLELVNVAFRSELWHAFMALAGHAPAAASWDEAESPPLAHVDEPERTRFTVDVDRLLQAHHSREDQVELLCYLSAVVRLLVPEPRRPLVDIAGEPDWLTRACRAMYEPENLRVGFSRFVSLSGVSDGHLARTVRRYRGRTPVELITELRLTRAAVLLEATATPVSEVALESGFDNISYFHRRFRQRFGRTPRAHRFAAGRQLAP
jgi:AraC family cel operon transcriptional repressor